MMEPLTAQPAARPQPDSGRHTGDCSLAGLSESKYRRGRRVIVLLGGIVLLSVADLFATLANLHSIGMVEANPVARFIIEHSASWGLVMFKALTVGVCIALLYRLRHHLQGEIASWLGVAILVTLSLYWGHYTRRAHAPETLTQHLVEGVDDDRWLTLADDPPVLRRNPTRP